MQFGSVLFAIFGIGLLIFIHELGHFLAARLAGVRVEVFSLGFGQRLCGCQWRGTDFRLSLIPFGGFVMVAGQDPTDTRYPARESLYGKSIGQRMWFWSGGVLMNALFALIVFPFAFHAGVPFTAPVVGGVQPGGAAWEADIQPGDRILSVQGKQVRAFENLATEVVLHGQRAVTLLVQTGDDAPREVVVRPHFNADERFYELGVSPEIDQVVLEVTPDGPAGAAGLRTGDRLLAVNGIAAKDRSLTPALTALEPASNAAISIQVERDGKTVEATATPRLLTDPLPARIGVRQVARRIAGVRQGSRLVQGLELRAGDLILAIDDKPFVNSDLAVARTGPERMTVHLVRDGREIVSEQPATAAEREELPKFVALEVDAALMLAPLADGPARKAGLQDGDRLETVDGKDVRDIEQLRDLVERAKPMQVRVRRLRHGANFFDPIRHDLPTGDLVELTINPERAPAYSLGISLALHQLQEEVRATSTADALRLGASCSLDLVKQFLVTLKRLVTGDVGAKNLGGIIRISQVSYQAAQRGPVWFWYFLALLSVNLAFVNLLPVPVLDGGHLLFLFIEKVKGSPVSTKVLGYSQVVGLVFVLLLVLFVTYNDILRLF